MARQTKIVNMSLPPELYTQVDEMAKQKGVSRSQLLKEALRIYIVEEKRWQQIRKWGKETAKRLGIKNEKDIERIRDEYWEECRRESLSK